MPNLSRRQQQLVDAITETTDEWGRLVETAVEHASRVSDSQIRKVALLLALITQEAREAVDVLVGDGEPGEHDGPAEHDDSVGRFIAVLENHVSVSLALVETMRRSEMRPYMQLDRATWYVQESVKTLTAMDRKLRTGAINLRGQQ